MSFIREILDDSEQKILTLSQLKKILLREKVKVPDWFVKKDMTGRVKLIKDKKKLHRAMVLIQFADKRQKSFKECQYHVFEALRDTR